MAQIVPSAEFPFCGPTNLSVSPVIDAERSINLYPERQLASAKTQTALIGRPGLAYVGATRLGTGFGHSLYAGAGRLFVSTGTNVYEIASSGAIITNYGAGISNFGPTQTPMIANGTQLLVCDPAAGQIFNVNPSGPSLDPVFNGVALEFLDDFYIAIATGASLAGANPNQLNVSANGDGTTWPGLAFTFETSAADLIIQLATLNSLVYIFGQKTLRIWYNAGNPIFPFARVNGGVINLGCLAAASVVKFSNSILWLGSDATGYGQVYMMQGQNPVRVSNAAIETMIRTLTGQFALTSAVAYGYQEAGHTFYVLNFSTNASNPLVPGGLTLAYDLTTGLWHERAYGGSNPLIPTSFATVPDFGGNTSNFILEALSGQLLYQGIVYASDGIVGVTKGTPITYTRIAPHAGNQNRWVKYPRFELDIDPQATGSAGTIAPIMDYSNNGGRSFLGYNRSMAQAYDQGAPTAFQRFYALELGRSRDRVFKVTITDDTNLIRISNAYLSAGATS